MKYIGENAIKKLISLIKGDLATKQPTITASGLLKGDGTGTVTAADTQEATLVDVPNGLLKGDGTTISQAVAGTDYVNSSQAIRYDAAQSLNDAQKTRARANIAAAPDGFGYGGALDTVSGATDEAFLAAVESKLAIMPDTGAMQINWGSYPALDGLSRVGTLTKHGDQYASLTGYSYGGTAITRCKNAGTWGPWEYVNPPLNLGVEYRTTERYLGNCCVRMVDSDGIEYWSSPVMPYWHSAGKAIAHNVPASGNIAISLMNNRTYFLASSDNVRSGLVAVQTNGSVVTSITPIIPLRDWNVTLGTGLTVNVAELDGRFDMKVSMTCLY